MSTFLKNRIKENYGTQRTFAKQIGYTTVFVNGIVNGRYGLSEATAAKFAKALKTSKKRVVSELNGFKA